MAYTILFSNIGYAKGIDGSLKQHVFRFGRHFYAGRSVQEQVLSQLKSIIALESPDLCCFVEIDQGSIHSAYVNQIRHLLDDDYRFYDIYDKYGENSFWSRLPLHKGKSNAFMAKTEIEFKRLYFEHGTKRLIYALDLPGNIRLFFAHFSLQKEVRIRQFEEVRRLVDEVPGEVMIMADFNIMEGFSELDVLLEKSGLKILNNEKEFTFTFHRRQLVLDLCLCSEALVARSGLEIIKQPYSDHAALLVKIT